METSPITMHKYSRESVWFTNTIFRPYLSLKQSKIRKLSKVTWAYSARPCASTLTLNSLILARVDALGRTKYSSLSKGIFCFNRCHLFSFFLSYGILQFRVTKDGICTGLILIRNAYKCAFYCQRIAFFREFEFVNILHWIETKPVQMRLLSNCTAVLRWCETGLFQVESCPFLPPAFPLGIFCPGTETSYYGRIRFEAFC